MRGFLSALFWLLRLAIILVLATWVYLHPGTITMDWQGSVIETSVGFAVLVLAVAMFAFAILYHGWRVLLNAPTRWKRWRHVRSLELGYRALNKGLLAVAAADSSNATKQAKKAEHLLPSYALTHLLAAQAAQLRGDDIAADAHLGQLAQHPDGQLFGLRGQLTRALQRQDKTEALRLARQAHHQQPGQPWIIDTLVQLEARQRTWLNAEKVLRQALLLDSPDHTRWQQDLAAALCALSDEARERNDLDAALYCAREARKRAPDWAPAAVRVAQLWQRKAYRRRAQKVLANAWERQPHPDLIKAWLAVSSGERNADAVEIVERLVRHSADHVESALAMARASLDARLWGVARQHAQRAINAGGDKRAYVLMAEIEQGDARDSKRARIWTEKADTVQDAPQWICKLTGERFEQWQPLNRRMDFNTILWQRPDAAPLLQIGETQLTLSS